MKQIIAKSRTHLSELIYEEIQKNGLNCDLNHINVSNIWNMDYLFATFNTLGFNGNISEWDVSNVKSMHKMFFESDFNGDISKWNTSNVIDMSEMFYKSKFNGDISKWNVSKVEKMGSMFAYSKLDCDISDWNVSSVKDMNTMFYESNIKSDLSKWKPYNLYISQSFPVFKNMDIYWAKISDIDERKKAIDTYWLNKELQQDLTNDNKLEKKMKI